MVFSLKSGLVKFVPVLAAGTLVIAGCSDGGNSAQTTPAETSISASQSAIPQGVNAADIEFLEGMYPHHAQALDMAKMVDGRTDNAELIALAAQIEAAQGPEMQQMSEMLTQWGRPDPASNPMAGMDHGGHGVGMADMPGMMSDDDMAAMMDAQGVEFDKMWLTMMIEHHTGAITMSQTELDSGLDSTTEKLAEEIIAAQQAEIVQMQTMLAAL